MKIISPLCAFLAIAVATAGYAQEHGNPKQDTPPVLPDIHVQDNIVHIPYLTFPQQEIQGQLYGNQYLPDGVVLIPLQDSAQMHSSVRIELNLNHVPIQEALKRLFAQVKMEFTLEKDVPADTRITLRLKNVTFVTALNAITEEANVGWNMESGGMALRFNTYHIGKNRSNHIMNSIPLLHQNWPRDYYTLPPQNYWYVQPGSDDSNNINLNYNLMPDLNDSGILKLQPGQKRDEKTVPNNIIQLPLNYHFINGSDLPWSDTNILKLPMNFTLSYNLKTNSDTTLKINPLQQDAAPAKEDGGATQQGIPMLKDLPLIGRLFTVHGKEDRSIFTCPHCHQEITVIKKSGTDSKWKFCPVCGKEILDTTKKPKP